MGGNPVKSREISQVWTVRPQQESPIHKVAMVLEPGHFEEYDPFLFMAEDWFQRGVFDFHPHRGMETVTYIIEGTLEHTDNKGGAGKLEAGDTQWMTAGRGIIHKEEPAEGVTVHSLQLWINLPAAKKMTTTHYQDLQSHKMPLRQTEGAQIRVFSGSSGEVSAPTKNQVPVTMVEITLEPGATVSQDLPGSYNGFVYVLEGSGVFGASQTAGKKNQVLWTNPPGPDGASELSITAGPAEPLKVVLYAGQPIREKVVAYGPFVMNSEQEIRQAYSDFRSGKFD
jgi:redox-sensitive bicupin YhaK (pirin superfamily)